MNIFIGTSGWSYYNWKGHFYPTDMKPKEWLSFYAKKLDTVELNSSFYSLPKPASVSNWCNNTTPNFKFAIKAWNMITHKHKLVNSEDSVKQLLNSIKLFGSKAEVVLFQLPQSFAKDLKRITYLISLLPADYRYVFELRHSSWWDEETYSLLKANNIAFCFFELGKLISPQVITADFIYARLHGCDAPYQGKYSNAMLQELKQWLTKEKKDAYVYFDNTTFADDAISNALELKNMFYG